MRNDAGPGLRATHNSLDGFYKVSFSTRPGHADLESVIVCMSRKCTAKQNLHGKPHRFQSNSGADEVTVTQIRHKGDTGVASLHFPSNSGARVIAHPSPTLMP